MKSWWNNSALIFISCPATSNQRSRRRNHRDRAWRAGSGAAEVRYRALRSQRGEGDYDRRIGCSASLGPGKNRWCYDLCKVLLRPPRTNAHLSVQLAVSLASVCNEDSHSRTFKIINNPINLQAFCKWARFKGTFKDLLEILLIFFNNLSFIHVSD